MHFTQIFAAILALPVLSMAAAVPVSARQVINRSCEGFNTLTVGKLLVSNKNERQGDAILQIKPEGADGAWQTKLFIPKGARDLVFDVAANTGVKNLRVCKASGGFCHFPVSRDANKKWNFKVDGDRWAFQIDVIDGSDEEIQGVCGVSTDKVTVVPVVPPPTTTTTSTTTRTTTTTTKTSTTTNKTTTTTTARPGTTTSTSTRSRTTTTRPACTRNCN